MLHAVGVVVTFAEAELRFRDALFGGSRVPLDRLGHARLDALTVVVGVGGVELSLRVAELGGFFVPSERFHHSFRLVLRVALFAHAADIVHRRRVAELRRFAPDRDRLGDLIRLVQLYGFRIELRYLLRIDIFFIHSVSFMACAERFRSRAAVGHKYSTCRTNMQCFLKICKNFSPPSSAENDE